jgi:hypothetical protein
MSFVFLLIFWLTSLRTGGPQQGALAPAVDPGPGAGIPAFGPGLAFVRRPVGHPGQTQVIAEGVLDAASEEDSQDSELCGCDLSASLDLLAGQGNHGTLISPWVLGGQSPSPSRSPLLRC